MEDIYFHNNVQYMYILQMNWCTKNRPQWCTQHKTEWRLIKHENWIHELNYHYDHVLRKIDSKLFLSFEIIKDEYFLIIYKKWKIYEKIWVLRRSLGNALNNHQKCYQVKLL